MEQGIITTTSGTIHGYGEEVRGSWLPHIQLDEHRKIHWRSLFVSFCSGVRSVLAHYNDTPLL